MKISIHFLDDAIGTGEATGSEPVRWEGDMGRLSSLADFYSRRGLQGEALLRYMLERLNGRYWAQEIEPGELPDLLRDKINNPEEKG